MTAEMRFQVPPKTFDSTAGSLS